MYPYPYQQQMPQQMPQQANGFVSVPSEEAARNYPVAPGNCITFKVEGQPIVIEKSMGFSQLDSPRIEKFQLVRMEPPKNEYVSRADYDALREYVGQLDERVRGLTREGEKCETRSEA